MRALIVDCETTGIDPAASELVEVGMILYSVTNRTTLMEMATLLPIKAKENAAERVNRIPYPALLEISDIPEVSAANTFLMWFNFLDRVSDFIVAHNAEFDRAFLPKTVSPWLCTMNDFQWPNASKLGQSLVSLALEHGIGVSTAHRARTDCGLIAELFNRQTGLEHMFEVAARPKALYKGLAAFAQNGLMKDAGFKWNPEKKGWFRRMAIEDATNLPFDHLLIEERPIKQEESKHA